MCVFAQPFRCSMATPNLDQLSNGAKVGAVPALRHQISGRIDGRQQNVLLLGPIWDCWEPGSQTAGPGIPRGLRVDNHNMSTIIWVNNHNIKVKWLSILKFIKDGDDISGVFPGIHGFFFGVTSTLQESFKFELNSCGRGARINKSMAQSREACMVGIFKAMEYQQENITIKRYSMVFPGSR